MNRRWISGATCLLIACGDADGSGGGGADNASSISVTSGASGSTSGSKVSSGSGSPTSTGATSTSTGGGPSPGCGQAAAVGQTDRTLMVDGQMRSYSFRIADPYDPTVPHPLVFALHGAGANGAQAVGTSLEIGGVRSITVGPSSLGQMWSPTVDLPLIDALVDALPDELCIDTTRIFAWGYSSGGFMANDIGCARADVFRGIGLVDGGGGGNCQTPIGVWITHNQDDMTVPISYGTGARDAWLQTNGCTSATVPTDPSPCVRYEGCSAGHPVVWCNPATGGHSPPGYTGEGLSLFFSSL